MKNKYLRRTLKVQNDSEIRMANAIKKGEKTPAKKRAVMSGRITFIDPRGNVTVVEPKSEHVRRRTRYGTAGSEADTQALPTREAAITSAREELKKIIQAAELALEGTSSQQISAGTLSSEEGGEVALLDVAEKLIDELNEGIVSLTARLKTSLDKLDAIETHQENARG